MVRPVKEWPEDAVRVVSQLLKNGATYAVIAERYQVSRNQVAHFVDRNGLAGLSHRSTSNKFLRVKANPAPRVERKGGFQIERVASIKAVAALSAPVELAAPSTAISYDDYDDNVHCGWPVCDSPRMVCGGAKLPGRNERYCEFHKARGIMTPRKAIPYGYRNFNRG